MSTTPSERLVDRSVVGFLDDVASSAPVPGGGSVAALTGAASAGLLQMVCGVFLTRPRYADRVTEIRPMLSRAESLRQRLTHLVDADATAYLGLVASMRLPKRDAFEETSRRAAVQQALRLATRAPLDIATACSDVVRLASALEALGSGSVVSDARVAGRLGQAALLAALDTAQHNATLIDDQAVQESVLHEAELLRTAHDGVASPALTIPPRHA